MLDVLSALGLAIDLVTATSSDAGTGMEPLRRLLQGTVVTDRLLVYLDGVLAGRLTQAAGGALSFSYDDVYLTRRAPTPPLTVDAPERIHHSNRVVLAWLDDSS